MKLAKLNPAFLLAGFGLAGALLLVVSWSLTHEEIARQEKLSAMRSLQQVLPPGEYDENLMQAVETLPSGTHPFKGEMKIFQARQQNKLVTTIYELVTAEGYSGDIRLLAGIDTSGRLTGVRIISHKETPGLGDGIHQDRSDWILNFAGKSLQNPQAPGWKVRKDGGQFDQLTGATISPRAVVDALHELLLFHQGRCHDSGEGAKCHE